MLKTIIGLAIVGLVLVGLSFALTPTPTAPAKLEATKGDTLSLAATGKNLFLTKGCAVCHVHAAVAGSGRIESGPNLSKYKVDENYLQSWLADPKAVKAAANMPRLDLSKQEITALIAFLSNP